MNDLVQRKRDHIQAVLSGNVNAQSVTNGFDAYRFEHCALPEINLIDVSLESQFLGRKLRLPFVISSMTGGPERARTINANLAVAAEALGIALGVGSQRVALAGDAARHGLDNDVRRLAPNAMIFANIGAAQLGDGVNVDHLRRAVDMIDANALIVHLNPLQEALQIDGDTDWRGITDRLAMAVKRLDVPIIVKEVGFGVSGPVAQTLADCGVAAIDVAGAGGTSWSAVEAARSQTVRLRVLGELFREWGIPTAEALVACRRTAPHIPLIASGGIRHGLDAAKAIALGADLVGQAGPVLRAAIESPEAVIVHFQHMADALRLACFGVGAGDLASLRRAVLKRE